MNGHAKAKDASPAKIELSEYVLNRAGIADIAKGTARMGQFTVWPRRLRKGVRNPQVLRPPSFDGSSA